MKEISNATLAELFVSSSLVPLSFLISDEKSSENSYIFQLKSVWKKG